MNRPRKRIAVGGFQHETNTFATVTAGFADFERADGWPALSRGTDLLTAVDGMNLPAAGFIAAASHEIVPLLWCSASPSGPVETAAFDRIAGMLCADLEKAGPIDGLYLDLHGAMVTEAHEDGEGELLARVRRLVGPDLPIVVSLDLHANVSPQMVDLANVLIAYRTYPHVDMAATGARAAQVMDRLLWHGNPTVRTLRQVPFLVPLVAQCTLEPPARDLYERMMQLEEQPGILSLSIAMGFPTADIFDCGPSILAYGMNGRSVDAAADALARAFEAAEPVFGTEILSPDDGVVRAMALAPAARGPIILADTQDNPGGGAEADGVAVIEALLRHGASGALVGLLKDPEAARRAHMAGEGAIVDLELGAGSGYAGARPLKRPFRVVRLGDGTFSATGPFYAGCRMQLGPMALLEADGVLIAVSSRKQQAADQAMFRHLGIEPAEQTILVLKSSVHFRADFGPIAEAVLVVAAPGPNTADPGNLTFRRLRPGVRRRPGRTPEG